MSMCIFVASCRAFTITAVAQLCVLGIMWIFGCFQFEENTIIMSYLFTIFGSLQGVMLFVMHCLLSKQVRRNPLSYKEQNSAAIFLVSKLYIVTSGEGRVWKHHVQIMCTKEEELRRLQ